ncbi:FHA domain protein (plasmid) [Aquisphaera giovannonii]|uniref:FHA domain protein n=1 Tax=Aquisphaera giovannonii TaxID=406548 RepID=A0A5B9WEY8_9BACT|nr:FHA domain-containing protein [Aquisphaera giovannonii]QEH39216.1 FHA domain protein [Aquisphaera giovannonii]
MPSFLEACDVPDALEIGVRGLKPGEDGVLRLDQPFALIGRDPRADVSLDHRLVSRRHVYLQVVEGAGFWIDLDSRSGTSSAGQLRKSGWLDFDSPIHVGPFEIRRPAGKGAGGGPSREAGARVSPLVSRAHAGLPLPDVSLEFLNGPSRAAVWPMNRVMSLIGSASGCKFRLADPSVSSFHCSLVRTPLGLWAIDLLAPDGIAVNEVRSRFAPIADEDVLRVGRYRIRIRIRSAGGRPRPHGRGPARTARAGTLGLARDPDAGHPSDAGPLAARAADPGGPATGGLPAPLPGLHPSSIAWASVTASPSIDLGRGDIDQSMLVPLVNQFGAMQQQMLDQFQQAVSMLVQMFGNLHRDQMNTIREELDQLKDLTAEVQAIKLELAARSGASTPVQPTLPEMRRPAEAAPADHAVAADMPEEIPNPIAARIGPATPDPSPVAPPPAPDPSPIATAASRAASPPAAAATAAGRPRPGAAADPGASQDVILWLHQRMTSLQQERETRWQKILKLLPGAS